MTQHYVEFIMGNRGFLFEYESQPIESRDQSKVTLPEGAIGYRFYSRTETVNGDETLVGPVRDKSTWTYFGTKMTLEEVEARNDPNDEILISNLRVNHWPAVAFTAYGRSLPVMDGDTVIPQ